MIKKELGKGLRFMNHNSARIYFKEVYGELFMLQGTAVLEGTKTYFYHFITNKEQYIKFYKQISKGYEVDREQFSKYYQEVDVTENGHVTLIEKGEDVCQIRQKNNQSDTF